MDVDGREADIMDDIENQKMKQGTVWTRRFLVAIAVFTLYSYLVMNEGAVRSTQVATPEPAPFSETLRLVAACGEVLFGLAGFLMGIALILFRQGNKFVTISWMGLAFVLGWFVFSVWVLAFPIWNLVNVRTAPEPLTIQQFDLLRTMSLFGGIFWCFALQGGQFMVGNVIRGHQDQGKTRGEKYAQIRLIMWSLNIALSGIVFVIAGSVASVAYGAGPLDPVQAFPPIFIVYPGLTIAAGIVQFLFGTFAISAAIMGRMFKTVTLFAAFSYLFSLATIVWTPAFLGGIVPATTLLAGLCTMIHGNVAYSASEYEQELLAES
uniref:Uncharacterized protein n=1 Tax=Rhodosorus marinus TaxID=101924 RepID=A0A7S3A453_9RHOD|mmetsp:Transcript_44162/g.172186  ORF Transcript_44162/g.172186 Transcript_44162/m.172186 type:complete len:322 (+) Transcript_44162:543-1508(+)